MCASGAQNTVQNEDIATMQQYNQEQAQQYANQQALYKSVTSVLQPILNAGPSQQGYSAAELSNLNATAVEGTAENYQNAAKAVNEQIAGEGGGEELPTGGQQQLKEEVATSAAGQESTEESQIESADYAQGNANFQNAEQGELAVASGEDPIGYANANVSAENAAGNEANAVASENNSWINAALGAAGTIGRGFAGV